jgi:hypothetical protein
MPAGVKGRGAALNQFFLRLHGLWEGIVTLPRPPPPPFDIETMEPIEPPWLAIKEWIPDDEPDLDWFNRPRNPSNPDPAEIVIIKKFWPDFRRNDLLEGVQEYQRRHRRFGAL